MRRTIARALRRRENPERVVVRAAHYIEPGEGAASFRRSGHLYRGMTQAEFEDTVGAGRGVMSKNLFSLEGEGTSLADDPEIAEDYANFGSTDPRRTGLPNYLVEIDPSGLDFVTINRQGYYYAFAPVPQDRVTRVWKMDPDGSDVVAEQIL